MSDEKTMESCPFCGSDDNEEQDDDHLHFWVKGKQIGVDPKYFIHLKDFEIGDLVEYESRIRGKGNGIVDGIWYGIEEMMRIKTKGEEFNLCPALGDKITLVQRTKKVSAGYEEAEVIIPQEKKNENRIRVGSKANVSSKNRYRPML